MKWGFRFTHVGDASGASSRRGGTWLQADELFVAAYLPALQPELEEHSDLYVPFGFEN